MNSVKVSFIVVSFIVSFHSLPAFVFDIDDDENINLMNHRYDDECVRNESILQRVNEFKTKFDRIKRLSHNEVKLIRRQGFRTVSSDICEAKRDIAKTMTPFIQPTADFCVADLAIRKKFVLNTLLLLETILEFTCGMNQSHYEDIYEWQSEKCLNDNAPLLRACHTKSFDVYFWEKVPEKLPSVTQLINGAVCNFNFDKMLSCSSEVVTSSKALSCSIGAIELLSYQFDVIKQNSLCFKMKSVSEIIDSSSESMDDVVM